MWSFDLKWFFDWIFQNYAIILSAFLSIFLNFFFASFFDVFNFSTLGRLHSLVCRAWEAVSSFVSIDAIVSIYWSMRTWSSFWLLREDSLIVSQTGINFPETLGCRDCWQYSRAVGVMTSSNLSCFTDTHLLYYRIVWTMISNNKPPELLSVFSATKVLY